ncbi:Bodo-specific multi-copy gene family, putative [Bodo saltans]|uniref:Bodo-specific multi-copy gene family, putative n=1 Tax=Bodo saltans TaxID=75058 RepID=A0A0S4IK61_BODSA|nr:Bodo-specific multi-copy gene family, putative [Bodo saltans]|eukprot:CUE63795.1 Bodo-specific multi-copy gene family, putative [Bodo saltans]
MHLMCVFHRFNILFSCHFRRKDANFQPIEDENSLIHVCFAKKKKKHETHMRKLGFPLSRIETRPLFARINLIIQRCAATTLSGGEVTGAAKYYDARTWPKHWTATDVERLLCGNLLHPTAKPNYESLALLLRNGDHKSLALLLRAHIKPPPPTEVHLEQYLGESLNNTSDSAAMPLQERTEQLNFLDAALSPQPGSVVPRVVFCSSPRGSGKTQFIKWFVSQKRAEAMKYGRVIVRCCDKTSHQTRSLSSWMNLLLESRLSEKPASRQPRPPTNVLCQLICAHVEAVTGSPQNSSNYGDPKTAYATWMSETARCFGIPSSAGTTVDPLIILDTCELLAEHDHNGLVKSSGKPYTLLEAFCLAVPAPYGIFVVGCNAQIDTTDPKYLSMANVADIGPLVPLSARGYDDAIAESWKYEADPALRAPLHHLAGWDSFKRRNHS